MNPDTRCMLLSEAGRAMAATLTGADVSFTRVSIDTRTLQGGELFVAISGANFDGHDFIAQAVDKGAAAVVVHREVNTALPQLLVRDTRLALGQLAAAWRAAYAGPVLAVTGSNGKTTVKEMLAAILGCNGNPLATQGNLNNDIGVPLTLLRLQPEHTHAVIEMGANHAGEIAYLCGLAVPDVGIVTNAMAAHLEGFGDLDGVARAKGEMFAALPMQGTAILNADDAYADYWRGQIGSRRCLSFGLAAGADITAQAIAPGDALSATRFQLRIADTQCEVELPLFGEHNVRNALAAAAAATAVDIPLSQIQAGLESMQAVAGRLVMKRGAGGAAVIDDTYNANPDSVAAALQVLSAAGGRTVLVLGDMAELGRDAGRLHAAVGRQAHDLGIQRLYALGPMSAKAAEAFGAQAQVFSEAAQLVAVLRGELTPETTVLIKGSRAMHMERVVRALLRGAADGTHDEEAVAD